VRTVLIANRGEIAVRVARACRDAGLRSVAVYAEPDRDAEHVRLADEAHALGGSTAADSYLVVDKVLDAARRSGADAVHPGYGFLSENADFAQAVLDAGLTWIGPPPDAIRVLGDKVAARHLAAEVGAPQVPGTADPVAGPEEVLAFAEQHGLPVAIKAAFGGGGRGLKVARTMEEIPELFASAVREAQAAFGRGECFVERYLDKPRHVEAQVMADQHGTVTVVGTRDCSLQRRHQKLVEEAPAPFLSDEQRAQLHTAARDICAAAGYVGAGTVEFLVGLDGVISFLEVNTRLQVEHPVTEETSGVDLVRAQLAVAAGARLADLGLGADPRPRGHSFEFRINGEDPGRNFLPAPGTVTGYVEPAGPGVRVDSGVRTGSMVGGAFDSLLAKIIVTGASRAEALERARRVLDETVVEGLPTVLPFHRAVVRDPDFTDEPFRVHTRWIETEWAGELAPWAGSAEVEEPAARETVVVEVGGKRLEVTLPAGFGAVGAGAPGAGKPGRRSRSKGGGAAVSGDALTSPMQGTIVKIAVSEGDQVAAGDLVVVLEAMKMEQPLTAHKAGTVKGLSAVVGEVVASGTVVCELVD
jgi:acetyl-CoA/propionyl-CoA/long-chain acyl-CoA carboxylase, biotin carboxylase, biotin carboxyl carrier protein